MDREYLNQIKTDLQLFTKKVIESGHALDFLCLIPVLGGKHFVIQADGGWIQEEGTKALIAINHYLFETTTPDLREKIYTISSYKKNGKWQCPSEDFLLLGEMPLIVRPAYYDFEV